MNNRSTNTRFTHFGGDLWSNVESSHGVGISGGSTGGAITAVGDDANITLTIAGKGTGATVLGNSSSPVLISNSTTAVAKMQRYFVEFTVPALSSAGSAESTVTVVGLTTNSILVLQPRVKLNSTVTGVFITGRCSTADELVVEFHNGSLSTLTGSTQSAYVLQFAF